jgi:hypothetical protein
VDHRGALTGVVSDSRKSNPSGPVAVLKVRGGAREPVSAPTMAAGFAAMGHPIYLPEVFPRLRRLTVRDVNNAETIAEIASPT